MDERDLVLADEAVFGIDDDDMPVGRIWTRREALALPLFAGLVGLAGRAEGQQAVAKSGLVATPDMTEGPFFVDRKLNRADLRVGTSREAVVKGAALALEVKVYALTGGEWKPVKGAYVDLWQCDAHGVYSGMASNPIQREDTEGQDWLRGYQTTDGSGAAKFLSIYPGCYQGRTTHIHFKIRTYSTAGDVTREFTSQFFFDDEMSDKLFTKTPYTGAPRRVWNRNDGLFQMRQADGTRVGSHLMLDVKEDGKGGYTGSFTVALVMD